MWRGGREKMETISEIDRTDDAETTSRSRREQRMVGRASGRSGRRANEIDGGHDARGNLDARRHADRTYRRGIGPHRSLCCTSTAHSGPTRRLGRTLDAKCNRVQIRFLISIRVRTSSESGSESDSRSYPDPSPGRVES